MARWLNRELQLLDQGMKNNKDKNIRAKVLEIVSNRIKPNEYIRCVRTGCNNCIKHDSLPLHHQKSSEYIDRLTFSSASVTVAKSQLGICSNIFNFAITSEVQKKDKATSSPNKHIDQVNLTDQDRRSKREFRLETNYSEQNIKNYIQQWVQFALMTLAKEDQTRTQQYNQINLPFENSKEMMKLKERIIGSVKVGLDKSDSIVFPYKLGASKQTSKSYLEHSFLPNSPKVKNMNSSSPQKSIKNVNQPVIQKNVKNEGDYSGSMSTLGSEKSMLGKTNLQINEQMLRMLLIQSISIQNNILVEPYQ